MKKIVIMLTILIFPLMAQAAGPYMHALVAEHYLDAQSPPVKSDDRELFIIGTIYPDIRYLGVIKRSETHVKSVSPQQIAEESGYFRQGMLLHSWVDEFRQSYIRKTNIKENLQEIPKRLQDSFLKILEDQILQEHYPLNDMPTLIANIPQEEKDSGIPMTALTQWHAGLTVYFTLAPSLILSQLSFFDKGILTLDAATVKEWSALLPVYAKKPEYQNYVVALMAAMDKALNLPVTQPVEAMKGNS